MQLLKLSAVIVGLASFFSFTVADGSAEGALPPDIHECGSEASPVFPNKPKVRLFYGKSGSDHPSDHFIFYLDEGGTGFFTDSFSNNTKLDLEKIWGSPQKKGNTFELWGEYAFEKVERTRSLYHIDARYDDNKLVAYRIRGGRIHTPAWKKIEETGEKSK